MKGGFVAVLTVLLFLHVVFGQEDTYVSYATPKHGSVNGGTKLMVFGRGFDTELVVGDDALRKEIFLVNSFRRYACLVHDAESDERQMVCYTDPMDEGNYYVRVRINGVWLDNSHYCDNQYTGHNCWFGVRESSTPKLSQLDWINNKPQQLINVQGRIFTNLINSSVTVATNNRGNTITRVWLTSGPCSLLKSTDEPFMVELAGASGESDWGQFTCMVQSSFVGNQNISFLVDGDFGRSDPYTTLSRVSAENSLYMLQTYAVISDVNPKHGSTEGGTNITISGDYFDNLSGIAARVIIGGEVCNVVSVSDTEIVCTTSVQSSSRTSYSGGRGMKIEVFPGITDIEATLDSSTDGVWTFYSNSTSSGSIPGTNLARAQGFFVSAYTAKYQFAVKGNSQVRLYLSDGNDAANAVGVTTTTNVNEYAWTPEYDLIGGSEYYFEIRHLGNSDSSSFTMAVRIDKTVYTPSQTASSHTDWQNIVITSQVEREAQEISLQSWQTETAVSSIWEVQVQNVSCGVTCGGYFFTLTLFGISTDPLQYDSDASIVELAINSLGSMHGDTVSVFKTDDVYTLTFTSNRGRLQFTGASTNSSVLSISLTETTEGVAMLDTFSLTLGGFVSTPIPSDASVEQVQAAVESLYGIQCPEQLGESLGNNRFYYNDLEANGAQSGYRTGEQAFCGIYSTKHPSYLFVTNDETMTFRSSIYSMLCFAYIGDISDRVALRYTFKDIDNKDVSVTRDFYGIGLRSTETWVHFCEDLNNLLVAEHPDGSKFQISFVRIYEGGDAETDLYVDNILIASSLTQTPEQIQYHQFHIRPSAVPTIQLESIEVVKNELNYTVTFVPLECGNDFPLFEIAFATSSSTSSSDNIAYIMSTSSSIQVQRTGTASPPVTGTFDINFEDVTFGSVTGVAPDTTDADMKNLLESLPGVDTVTVERSENCYGYSWRVAFVSPGGVYPSVTPDGSGLIGNNPAITGHHTDFGGLFMEPVYGDFLRTSHAKPQVQVYINNILSHCIGDNVDDVSTSCDFEWTTDSTPTVTLVDPTTAAPGDTVAITGTGFSSTDSNNIVRIGGVDAVVTLSSPTSITITVENSPGGVQALNVMVADKGLAAIDSNYQEFTITSSFTTVSPSSGSIAGCTTLTIAGTGFAEGATTVMIDSTSCDVTFLTYNSITCVTSSHAAGTFSVDVTTSGVAATSSDSATFEYTATGTGDVTDISQSTLRVLGGEDVTITGTGFTSTKGRVQVSGDDVVVTSWSDTSIIFTSPGLSSGSHPYNVIIGEVGCATKSALATSLSYSFTVTDITPTTGSLIGGTTVTLTGTGFSNDVAVSFGDFPCNDVTASSDTSITCVTASASTLYYVTNSGQHPNYGVGYAWSTSDITIVAGDQIRFDWSFPEAVRGVAIGLYTVSDPTSKVYDEAGFEVPKSSSGSFLFRFNNVGKFYYFSGCLDDVAICSLFMRGSVTVTSAPSIIAEQLSVKLIDQENTTIQREAEDASTFSFTFSHSLTPTVTSVSPNNGTTDTTITIEGTGFTSTPEVSFNGKLCSVSASDATSITCQINPTEEMVIGIPVEVNVNIAGIGTARNEITNLIGRTFGLFPLISLISPVIGSLAGGTKLTIQGSGFTTSSSVVIGENGLRCDVVEDESTYASLVCITNSVSSDWSGIVAVTERGFSAECGSTCEYSYATSATPEVTGRLDNATPPSATIEMTFTGRRFGTTESDVIVTVGTETCSVTSLFDDEIVCTVGRFPVGDNEIKVLVTGKGLARFDDNSHASISNTEAMDTITPTSGSINGGTVVTLTGNGFVSSDLAVSIGGVEVEVTSSNFGEIFLVTSANSPGAYDVVVVSNGVTYPPISYTFDIASTPIVTSVSPNEGRDGDTITLAGSGFGSTMSDVTVTVGDVDCSVTSLIDSEIGCTLGARAGGQVSIVTHVNGKGLATVTPSFTYELSISTISPVTGSFGGGQEVTIDGQGFSEDSVVTICGEICSLKAGVTAAQLMCSTPANSSLENTKVCDVIVANGNDASTLSSAYTYDTSLTPVITSLTPSSGGTAGGTTITITGTGFGGLSSVSIDGSECIVDVGTLTETEITCVTEAHQGSIRTKVEVRVGTNGIATQDNADYFYIDKWSSIFTWGGTTVPTTQDFVIISKGQTVLLDTDTAVLKMLLINGGELIFDDQNVKLSAENILITNGGLLQVGTEQQPFTANAVIEMYGHLRSKELPIYGAKTLGVRNGTLEMHGRHIPYTWSKLDATAAAGDTQIILQHSVNWRVGDQIVIAPTGLRHSQIQREVREISAISSDGFTLTLTEALEYEHLGVTKTYGGDINIEYRAEVGLLSRNIIFRGTNDHVWNDPIEKCEGGFQTGQFAVQTCFQGRFGQETGSDQFGGSIMMHSQFQNTKDNQVAVAHIEYVEFTYVGQAFRLGRYPIHWHLMGDVSGMYVRGCAIHESFNRAITIHGTHNLLVDRNVAYDIMGGAFFIEDGIETGNIITHNLAIFVIQSTSLLNDDITPAAYWVTNPNNTLENNHAAGGTHFGFWYRMHAHPDGPSFDANICQQKVELGSFRNNTVHSQGWFGIWIFQTYFPSEGSRCSSNTPSPAKFYSLTTWNCEKGAEWVNVGAIQFIDFVVANNEHSGFDLKLISGTEWGEERGAMIKNAVIIGHSDSEVISDQNYETGIAIRLPIGPGLWMSKVRVFNFNRRGSLFGGNSVTGTCSNLCGGFYYWADQFEFTDVPRKTNWGWEHEGVIQDLDGSITRGAPNSTIVPYSGIVDTDNCVLQSGEEFGRGFPSAICQPSVHFHRMAFNGIQPSSLEGNDVIFKNQFGNTTVPFLKIRLTHSQGWMVLLTGGFDHTMMFKDGEQFTNISYNSRFYDFQDDEYVIVSHDFKQTPDFISINGEARYNISDAHPLTAASNNRDWFFDTENIRLHYIVRARNNNRKRRATEINDPNYSHESVSISILRCKYEDCIAPLDPAIVPPTRSRPDVYQLWSNETASCINRTDPNNTIILANTDETDLCWVLLDVPDVTLNTLTVYGVLEFTTNTNVSAIHILNLGGRLIAGYSDVEPFIHKLVITLRGDHDTIDFSLPGVNLGSKAIGCFGGCDFHGLDTLVQWTHLESTANIGATSIVVQDAVDWAVGNEIVITTTGYRAEETEKNVITSLSEDQKTIGLANPLEFRHMGEEYIIGDHTFPMRAEVGLLTRNIQIKGESYDDIVSEAFGARVLVGYTSSGNNDIYGWARISNVEFFQTGQEGWTEEYDPRFSLAWLDTGTVTEGRPSYVTECAFHDGFSTAIGTFGARGISITKNVVYRTIHDGIRITGSNHVLENNLVTVSLLRHTWDDRFEKSNFGSWHSNFEVNEATNLRMVGNVASGCERICFHIRGEVCEATDENAWTGNIAHGGLHGIQIFGGEAGPCSMIRNFVVYKAWDYGIYHQTESSIVIRNTIIADSTVNYLPIIFGPSALSHAFQDKTASLRDVLIVGRSDHFDPNLDFMDEQNDKNLQHRNTKQTRAASRNAFGGRTAIMLPMFESGPNGAPFKKFNLNKNYPSLHGLLDIQGLTLYNFGLREDNTRDLVFWTNPSNEDGFHPTYLSGVRLIRVEENSKVRFDRPSLGKVNPSDCVDMECDAKKKVLVKDLDGSFLGEVGAIVPDASFAWDDPNQLSRGLGDYRIPKTLLTAVDGTRVPVNDIIDTRGIIRNDESCTYIPSWQAFECKGPEAYDYVMLVIESLDPDTESRRLSPVALLGDRCIDLNNGPQDHGWCFGYTCQLRISTFYTIVATGVEFKLFFTGYPPRDMRLHLLNVDSTQSVRLAIYYPRPERLDIYRAISGLYIAPENAYYEPVQQEWLLHPPSESTTGFIPPFDTNINGANFMDRDADLLYVTLKGNEPITIITSPLIIIGFSFPAITIDEFFGPNIIFNLAQFLGVPDYKIRVVDVVREDSLSRKRRSTSGRVARQASDTVTYVIEIGEPIENGTGTVSMGDDSNVIEFLNDKVDELVVFYQTGQLWEVLNTTDGSGFYSMEATLINGTLDPFLAIVVHKIPTQMQITASLSNLVEQTTFENPITINLLDANGDNVTSLGGTWMVRVTLDSSGGNADNNAVLEGSTTVSFSNGIAEFRDLVITHSGTGYQLMFEITEPAGVNVANNMLTVDVANRGVIAVITEGLGNYVNHGNEVDLTLELQYQDGRPLDHIGFKGHVWKATVDFDDSSIYPIGDSDIAPAVTSPIFTFNPLNGSFTSTGLSISNTLDYNRYNLVFNVYTEPALYNFNVYANNVEFIPEGGTLQVENKNPKQIRIPILNRPYTRASSITYTTFETYIYNSLTTQINFYIYIGQVAISDLTTGNSEISFTLYGENATVVEAAVSQLTDIFTGSTGLMFNGQELMAVDQTCPVNVDGSCDAVPGVPISPVENTDYWYIVGPVIGVAVVMAAIVVALACIMKRAHRGKVGSSTETLRSPIDSFGGCSNSVTPQSYDGMTPIQS